MKMQQKRLIPYGIVVFFAVCGVVLLSISQAATPVASIEPENGTVTASAQSIPDPAASGGRAVVFGGNPLPGITPANPNLSREGRNVLAYLHSIEGKNILAGQQETDQCTNCESERLRTITGKAPAVHGHETADYVIDPMQEAINDWRNRRQLVTFSWHYGAPPLNDLSFENSRATADINKVLTPGTNENRIYMAKLDKMAGRLQTLENANVPVLWRPLHEFNGPWFWWSKSGPEPYKRLWVHMYDYYTKTKGLDNLIWVWSAALHVLPDANWYPGTQYVDITGTDTYDNQSNMTTWSAHYAKHKVIAPTKPVALTETDLIPNPDELQARGVKLTWFLPWYGQWLDKNPDAYKRQVYTHPYVITADEMPNLQ